MQTVARQTTGLRRANVASVGAPQRLAPAVMRPCRQLCRAQDDKTNPNSYNMIKTEQRQQNGDGKAPVTDQRLATSTPGVGGVKVDTLVPAFTRRREVFAGRLAMLGLVAAGFWEWYLPSHPNPVEQVAGFFQTAGLPVGPAQAATLLFGLVAYNAAAGLLPNSPTWTNENQQDVNKRPSPPADRPVSLFQRLGITNWGWTKQNELFNGRMAMIGFLAMLLQQVRMGGLTGPGVLEQIALFLGKPADEIFYATVPTFVAFSVFASLFSVVTGNTASQKKELGDYEIW